MKFFKQIFCKHKNVHVRFFISPLFADCDYDKCLDCGATWHTLPREMSPELKEFKTLFLIAFGIGIIFVVANLFGVL